MGAMKSTCVIFVLMLTVGSWGTQAQAQGPKFEIGASASYLMLPDIKFGKIDTSPVTEITDHDGDMGVGPRLDVSLYGRALPVNGQDVVLGISGFYSWFDNDQGRVDQCSLGCMHTSLFDNLATGFITIPLTMSTERDVRHYGLSLDVMLMGQQSGADTVNADRFVPRFGVAYKVIDQDTLLRYSANFMANFLQTTYREDLNTHYVGIYGGLSINQPVTSSLLVTLDGEVGGYYARTRYSGNLVDGFFSGALTSDLDLDRNKAAVVIAKLRLAVTQSFARISLTGFVEGEYYSYAPRVRYNDVADNTLFGPDARTSIADDNAYGLNAGVKINIPF